MDKELFNDLMASCNEAIEHGKGNIELRSVMIEVSDDEISIYSKYQKLSDNAKQAIHIILDEMLQAQPN
jgi:predicted transcriptional regulator